MKESVIISGFGGQGAILMGQVLAQWALEKGLEVTWIPSYGAEMRGGTANCTVIFSDGPIGSPVVRHPDSLIALNPAALERFFPFVKEGGVLIYNSSLIKKKVVKNKVTVMGIDAVNEAKAIGSHRAANMVILGAYLGSRGQFDADLIKVALKKVLGARKQKHLDLNLKALETGRRLVRDK